MLVHSGNETTMFIWELTFIMAAQWVVFPPGADAI